MAKGKNQFGAFGGVFTPSILTILGVIMYLRLPWVVGQAGLIAAVGIILVAHIVSVTTGLSISSIATDKKVGAGGPYYIVSRSLGLPIGGTLGFALFIGLSFSISLYVIGFVESFLDVTPLENTPLNVRLTGTLTLVALTIVTFISTEFALKSQFFILGAIALSLISIFFGTSAAPAGGVPMQAAEGGPSLAILFGVFFPAVTGFTAGVNMSGDLKDPKKALPVGTMAAIATGLVVYVGLAVFLAYRVDRTMLIGDPQALTRIAWNPLPFGGPGLFVIAGIWGATLSSALGSILGAPRILQALSGDGVFFRFFARGAGRTNEPRRALALAFCIAEAGILIGELNLIAAIVSMFFIAMYGFLNASCAIESWASTDFRPDFKIPKWVSIIGAITCVVLMIQLDLASTLATVTLFALVFWILKRRELTLESGDTWEGVWSSIVRSGLQRLTLAQRQDRNWRPNLLAFAPAGAPIDPHPLIDFGETLIRDRGVITRFTLVDHKNGQRRSHHEGPITRDLPEGVFLREVPAEDRYETIEAALRFHGFSGMEPNAVLLDWEEHRDDPHRFIGLLDRASTLDFNVMLLKLDKEEEPYGDRARIDVWWKKGRGSLALSLQLMRFLTSTDAWRNAEIRFLFIADEATRADTLMKTTERLLSEQRLQAQVKVLDNSLGKTSYEEWVKKESGDADLTILGIPRSDDCDAEFLETTEELIEMLGSTLLVRGSSAFRQYFMGGALAVPQTSYDALPILHADVPTLELPDNPDVRAEVERFARAHEAALDEFWEHCLSPMYGRAIGLVERVQGREKRELEQLHKGVEGAEGPRHKKMLSKARATLLFQARKILTEWETEEAPALGDTVERRIEKALADIESLRQDAPHTLSILREDAAYNPAPDDAPTVAKAKRRRRLRNALARQSRPYRVPTEVLYAWYYDYRTPESLWAGLTAAANTLYRAVREVGYALETTRRELAELVPDGDGGLDESAVAALTERAGEQLQSMLESVQEQAGRSRSDMRTASRRISMDLAADLERLDVKVLINKERTKLPPEAREIATRLPEAHSTLLTNLGLVIRRGELTVLNAAFQLRLATIIQRAKEQLVLKLDTGVGRELESLRSVLAEALERSSDEDAQAEPPRVGVDLKTEFNARRFLDDLLKEVNAAAAEVPEEFETVSDEALLHMVGSPFEEADALTLSLRRLVEFLVGAQFEEALLAELSEMQSEERRAATVAHDVVRLVQFQFGERGAEEEVADEDPEEQRRRVLQSGVERLDGELGQVQALIGRLKDKLDGLLATIIDRTDAYTLAGSEEGLRPYVASEDRRQALSFLGRGADLVRERAKDALVTAQYRRSAGVLYARKLAESDNGLDTLTERVRRVVEDLRPSHEVLRGLPFHYQQLFLRQARIGSEFWVGRTQEINEAARAVRLWRDGARGALMVVGERLDGKSSLCRQIAQRHFKGQDSHHIFPPAGGSVNPAALRQRFRQEIGARGDLYDIMKSVADGSLIVLHDVEMWWERSDDGLQVIDVIQELVEGHSDRLFFVLNAGIHAFRFLERLRGLSDQAFSVIECQPLDAESLRDVITRRHRSTGLRYEIDGESEDDMPAWREARLFTRYFDVSGGRVGTALNHWIASIERIQSGTLQMKAPRVTETDVLRELKPEWIALLLELVLHRHLTRTRLDRFSGLEPGEVSREVGALVRAGLVAETSDGVLEVSRFAHQAVARHLKERGVLP
jgi:amino acid transporter